MFSNSAKHFNNTLIEFKNNADIKRMKSIEEIKKPKWGKIELKFKPESGKINLNGLKVISQKEIDEMLAGYHVQNTFLILILMMMMILLISTINGKFI